MKRRRSWRSPWVHSTLLLALFTITAATTDNAHAISTITNTNTSTSTVVKYMSTNAPECDGTLSQSIVALYGRNRNIYTQCVADSLTYSLFPFSGYLPTDAQLVAMVSSLPCLYFFQAILSLPPRVPVPECNLGGLDIKSALETLLMTSQDVVANVAPLTGDQFIEFITWRHTRNIAKEINEPYDAASESAVAFERQLADAAARLRVSLSEELRILVNGSLVVATNPNLSDGSLAAGEADSEVRSLDDPAPGTVEASNRETSVQSTDASVVSSSSGSSRTPFATRAVLMVLLTMVALWF